MTQLEAESVFREVNDRIREVSSAWIDTGDPLGFICECDDAGCTTAIPLTIAEFDALRAGSGFVLVTGHRVPAVLAA